MSEGGLKTALGTIREEVKARFEAQKRVLSFGEYLELVQDSPRTHTRDASRYLKDCMDFFGSYEVERPAGDLKRWKLFDLEFGLHNSGHQGELRLRDRLAGHEATQEAFYRILDGFEREGRANRLVLLHGPNGSAKSTFARLPDARARGLFRHRRGRALSVLVDLSPRARGGGIGFSTSADELGQGDTFAHLARRSDHREAAELGPRAPLAAVAARRAAAADRERLRRRRAFRRRRPTGCGRPARPQEPTDLPSASNRVPRRSGASAGAHSSRAFLHLTALPRRGGDDRAPDVGRRLGASDHRRPIDRVAARVLERTDLVRALRRAG